MRRAPAWITVLIRWFGAVLFGSGMAHMLLVSQGLNAAIPGTVCVVAVSAALVYLWTRKIGVFVRVTLVLAVACVCVWAYDESLPERLEKQVFPLLNEIYLYFAGKQQLSQEIVVPSVLGIRVLMGVTAGLFAIRWPNAVVLTFIAGFFFFLEWIIGRFEILGSLPAVLLGVAMTAAAPLEGEEGSPEAARAFLPVGALCVGLAALILTATVVPDDTSGWRFRPFEIVVDDINDALAPYTHFTRPRHSFSIASSGFAPLGDRLGGPVSLGTTPALVVRAPFPLHLRGSVMNVYTGYSWLDSVDIRTYRFGGPLAGDRIDAVYDNDKPLPSGEAFGEELLGAFAKQSELAILHESYSGATLFSAGRVTSMSFAEDKGRIVSFDDNAELFVKDGAPTQEWYVVHANILPVAQPGFDQAALALEALSRSDTADDITRMNVFYLALPEDLPLEVRDAAAKAIAGAETDYRKALAIKAYLADFEYTLTPGVPPEGKDFVAHFLETRQGYCTYYATAVAVLARCAGIPSRYVEGYFLSAGDAEPDGFYHVDAASAHAWAELYIAGLGWIPFDATPVGEAVLPAENSPALGNGPAFVDEEILEEPTDDIPDLGFALPDIVVPRLPAAIYAFAGGAVLLALIALVTGLWVFHKRKFRVSRMLRVLRGDTREVIAAYWRDSVNIVALFGSPMRTGDTPNALARRVDGDMSRAAMPLYVVASLYSRSVFGGGDPKEDELSRASDIHADLMDDLIVSMGRARYFFARVLPVRRGNGRARDVQPTLHTQEDQPT